MGEVIKQAVKGNHGFWFLSIAAVLLITVSFFLPPVGVINESVLAAAGIILAFAALGTVNYAIATGKKATFKHNDTEVSVGDENE